MTGMRLYAFRWGCSLHCVTIYPPDGHGSTDLYVETVADHAAAMEVVYSRSPMGRDRIDDRRWMDSDGLECYHDYPEDHDYAYGCGHIEIAPVRLSICDDEADGIVVA